ncbi:hypothetical protein KUL118_23370 [Tenacibaculum sp. KUL118]|nr:hypothetical protein KUL118_23370 [Tenacibaculum sp. KUL118]
MKKNFTTWCLFTLGLIALPFLSYGSDNDYSAVRDYYQSIKQAVFSDPYPSLPQYKVSRKHFDRDGENLLLKHAKRTLSSTTDFIELEGGQKLLQANGICFAGNWRIGKNSSYTGFYSKGTNVPVIVRASVSLSGTKQNDKRAFGMAIKLFAESKSKDATKPQTYNLFVMHSLGGTQTKHVLSLPMTNEPSLGELPPFSQLLTAYRLENDLGTADKLFSQEKANARFRPVSHIAHIPQSDLTTDTPLSLNGPHWLKLVASTDTTLVDKSDFRDELAVAHYPNHRIQWDIYAAPNNAQGIESAKWQHLGAMTVNESVTSLTCDTRLHFAHPVIQ